MGTIVLDTNVVLSDPDVLAHKARHIKLLIPQAALDELRSTPRSRGKAYLQLIQSAMREGTLRKLEDELPGSNGAGPPGRRPRLSVLDGAMLLPPHYDVALATTDPLLRAQAKDRNVRTLDLSELRAELQNVRRSAPVRRDVIKLQNGNAVYLAVTLVMGVLAGAVMSEALHNPPLVAELLRHTAAYLLVPSAAVAFFWFRARFRLPYGFAEFISGGIAALQLVTLALNDKTLEHVSVLQFLTGVYVMVRGLDNIGKGLEHTPWGPRWQTWFPEKRIR